MALLYYINRLCSAAVKYCFNGSSSSYILSSVNMIICGWLLAQSVASDQSVPNCVNVNNRDKWCTKTLHEKHTVNKLF